ncbi:MAG: hypothetical protein GXP16_10105, partial [Gammaproteobacteria bacterium]|nr:hypothetical protein [Gammaproteobacteria bacterium]
MIWGAGGTFKPSELTDPRGYNRYDAVFTRLHKENVKGAYLVGFWDNYFARRDDAQESNHAPLEPWPSWHFLSGNPWNPGLAQLQTFIGMIPPKSKLIIAGASLGGGTAATIAGILARANRPINHLLLFDPVGMYGWRREAIAHPVPDNVRRFFNIWQEKGCWPVEYLVSGRFQIANPQYTTATQELFTGGTDAGPCIDSVSKSVHSDTWRHVRPSDGEQRIAAELLSAIKHVTAPPPHVNQSRRIDGSNVTLRSRDGTN